MGQGYMGAPNKYRPASIISSHGHIPPRAVRGEIVAEFFSRKEFAESIGVSVSTVWRGIKNNKWPFNAYVRIGHQLKYPIDLVEEIKRRARIHDQKASQKLGA
jgi:hypothetical protein